MNVAFDTSSLCQILEQSDKYSWELLHFNDWEMHKVLSRTPFIYGVYLVIEKYLEVTSNTSPLYHILRQSNYLQSYCILKIGGYIASFGYKHSFSGVRRISNFNSEVPQGDLRIYIQFETDPHTPKLERQCITLPKLSYTQENIYCGNGRWPWWVYSIPICTFVPRIL